MRVTRVFMFNPDDILHTPIQEEYVTKIISDDLNFMIIIREEILRNPNRRATVRKRWGSSAALKNNIRALKGLREKTRGVQLRIQAVAAQQRLKLSGILSGINPMPTFLKQEEELVSDLVCRLVMASVQSHLDAFPELVDRIAGEAREMIGPEYLENVAQIPTDNRTPEIVEEYLCQLLLERYGDALEEVLQQKDQ